jgi:hypothetical protein
MKSTKAFVKVLNSSIGKNFKDLSKKKDKMEEHR